MSWGNKVYRSTCSFNKYQHTYYVHGTVLEAGDPKMTTLLGVIVTCRVPGAWGLEGGWGGSKLRSDG